MVGMFFSPCDGQASKISGLISQMFWTAIIYTLRQVLPTFREEDEMFSG
jgi:hypothetical protein